MLKKLQTNFYNGYFIIGGAIILIYLSSFYSYTLFHSLAEIMTVIIGFGIFMVAWNSRKFTINKYFIFLGIAFAFIALLDLLHALAYKGLGVFIYSPGSNLATQLWLAARYLQGLSFLIAPFFIGKTLKISKIATSYIILSALLLLSILWIPIFPVAYIDGQGLTLFKEISELIICLFYTISLILLYRKKRSFNRQVFRLLIAALILSIVSELMFMIYVGVYDSFNLTGHLLRILSFGLLYLAFIEIGLRKPYAILFKELKDSEVNYQLSEEKFRTIFNNATVGIVMTNLNGKIIESNRRFINKLGYSKEDLLKLSLPDLGNKKDNTLTDKEFQEIKDGDLDYYEFEKCYYKKNGEILWGETSVSLIKDANNKPQNFLWVIRDVTQSKEMKNAKLEFVSLASHQLRTPLTSVRLATELLLRGVGGSLDSQQNKYLQEINNSANLMSNMIRDLLNVSRVEMGTITIKLEPLNLVNNFNQIIEELQLQVKAKNLNLTKDYSSNLPTVFFDHQILRMIFENILTNAICYTPANGSINIKVSPEENSVLLSISDTGCGIPESNKEQIFEKQFRAETAKEINPNGNGLGLYIVKSVAEKAGAKIWFESKEGQGTTFYVSIPTNNQK